MKKITFSNEDKMPVLGLGTWQSKPGEVHDAILEAIKIGYRHIDCAYIYENEREIGEAFSEAFATGLVKREELWITSKLWCHFHQKAAVMPALEKTLHDLQLDYLDLYLIHWPVVINPAIHPTKGERFISLEEMPLIETWEGMIGCLEQGLTKHIGVSNFSVVKLKDLLSKTTVKPEVNQIELHPYLQQKAMLEYCHSENIHLTAYSPLGSSAAAKMLADKKEPTLLEHPTINRIAEHHGCTAAQVLIKWAIDRGNSVIPKSVNPERIKQNFESTNVALTETDMADLEQLDLNFRFVDGSFWVMEGSPYTLENLWNE